MTVATGAWFEFTQEDVEAINTAVPLTAAPEGEYKVQIVGIQMEQNGQVYRNDKNGLPYIMFRLEVVDSLYKDFRFMHYVLSNELQGKKRLQVLSNIKDFFSALSFVPPVGKFNYFDLVERFAWAFLKVQTDPTYGDQNVIGNWVTPK